MRGHLQPPSTNPLAPRPGVVAVLSATAILVATIAGTARQPRALSVERSAPTALLVLEIAGCTAIVLSAWFLWISRPRVCLGLAVLSAGLLIPITAGWTWLPPSVRVDALAVGPLTVVGVMIVCESWRPTRRWTPTLTVISSFAGAAVVVMVLGYNPFEDPSCRRVCIDVSPFASAVVSTRGAVLSANFLTVTACGLGVITVWRRWQARPPTLITAGAVVALAVLIASAAKQATSWGVLRPSDLSRVLPTAIIAVAIGFTVLVVTVRDRRTRVMIDRLARRLAGSEPLLLAKSVRGIHFAVPNDGRWVDANGRDVEALVEGDSAVVSDESGPAVRLLVSRRTEAAELVAAFTPIARLALMNARLAAVSRARLSDVTTSRRRVVATADAERRRIERDLHDGAQQRLVSASFHLSAARNRLPEVPRALELAEIDVRTALAQLRELAHGMFPGLITTEGLRPALEDLVRASDVAVSLEMSDECIVVGEMAIAVYATVVAALDAAKVSNSAYARVGVKREHSSVVATIACGRLIDTDFTDVTDRVRAVGGRLVTVQVNDESVVRAEFSCE